MLTHTYVRYSKFLMDGLCFSPYQHHEAINEGEEEYESVFVFLFLCFCVFVFFVFVFLCFCVYYRHHEAINKGGEENQSERNPDQGVEHAERLERG